MSGTAAGAVEDVVPPVPHAVRARVLATIGVVSLVTLVAFESMAVATAMPVAAADLGGLRSYGLAFSLFLTTSLFGTVVAGSWSDRAGPRQPLLAGLVLFVGGLACCTLARTFGVLLVGRAISGAGGGVIVVALYVVVARVFPASAQPRVFGWISTAWVLPSVVGPPVAGLLTEHLSWRWVFGVVPFIVVLPVTTLWPRLPHGRAVGADGDRAARGGRRLLRGAALALGATGLQWGLAGNGLLGVPAPVLAVAGTLLAVGALPGLVPPGTLRLARGVSSLVTCRLLLAAGFFGAEAFVPLMLVTQRHWSPGWAGASLTSSAIGWAAGSWVQGRAHVPVARHVLLAWGGVLLGICVGLLALTPWPAVPAWTVAIVWMLGGFGMGTAISGIAVLTLQLSADGQQGTNSAAVQLGDALGGVLGIGVSGAVFAHWHEAGLAQPGLFSAIWLVLAPLALLVGLVALRVPPRRVEPRGADGGDPANR